MSIKYRLLVLFLASLFSLLFHSLVSLFNALPANYSLLNSVQLLTGNFLVDTVIVLVLTSPVILIVYVLKCFFKDVLAFPVISNIFLGITVFALILSFASIFQGIRLASGFAFLCAFFAIIEKYTVRTKLKDRLIYLCLLALPLTTLLIPIALKVNGLSFAHLSD